MRPIVVFPDSKNKQKAPSRLERYQQKRHKQLNDKEPVPEPAARNTIRAKSTQSPSRFGTEQTQNMTEKSNSQESHFANSVVTMTLKPHKSQDGVNGYSCQVISEVARPDTNGKVEVKVKPEKIELDQNQTKDKRISIDLSLEKLREEMNSLRKQDVELLDQLLTLNDSIQDFKLAQQARLCDSLSDLSEISDESDLESVLSINFQTTKAAPQMYETESQRCENLASKLTDLVPSCVTTSTKERKRADLRFGRNVYGHISPAEKAKQWHSQVSLKSENAWVIGNQKSVARRASLASYGTHCSGGTERKTSKQKRPLNEIKRSGSQSSLASRYSTGSCEKPETMKNSSKPRQFTFDKSRLVQSRKQKPKEIERSPSQTSLASDCSGYGTGSSEKLNSRSESPAFETRQNAFTASESRHNDATYYFSPSDEQTARWTTHECSTEYVPTSFGGDAIYSLGPSFKKTARSASLCCVTERSPSIHGDEMVYHFVTPVKQVSQSTSLHNVKECAPGPHRPSFVISAGVEGKEMYICPSVTLKCCSGVRYAATRPLRSFTKRQSTIW